jgi:hypothetical protein
MLFSVYQKITTAMGIQNLLANKRWLTEHKITLEKQAQNAAILRAGAYEALQKGTGTLETYLKFLDKEREINLELKNTTNLLNNQGTVWNLLGQQASGAISGIVTFLTGPGGLVLAIGTAIALIGVGLVKAYNSASDAAKEAA